MQRMQTSGKHHDSYSPGKYKAPFIRLDQGHVLYSTNKSGISGSYISKISGVSYPTTCLMLRKIKAAQAKRNDAINIEHAISTELDTFQFGGKSEGKRGLGEENKVCVAIAVGKKGNDYPILG